MHRILHRIPVDGLVTLFGFAGLALFLALYNSAFPSASLHLERSRGEIAAVPGSSRPAFAFLGMLGWQTTEHILSRQDGSPAGNLWRAATARLRKRKQKPPVPVPAD